MSWIKIRSTLPDDDALRHIAALLKVTRCHALGLVVRFWLWVDHATSDGTLKAYTPAMVDEIVSKPGFAAAMCRVKWLKRVRGGFHIPNFERWFGLTSKARSAKPPPPKRPAGPPRAEQSSAKQNTPASVCGDFAATKAKMTELGW